MSANLANLQSAILLACYPTNTRQIEQGRQAVLEMDRDFTLVHIEQVARECLNLDDYWEYRRFLELCDLLDTKLAQRVACWGIGHVDPDVREAGDDFTKQTTTG